jgi:cysteinyl-tRNA synthetase
MGYDPLHYRYLCFGAHYRSQLLFSFEALDGARNAFESLRNRVLGYRLNPDKPKNEKRKQELSQDFFAAMNHDLDTPVALSVVWETLKDPALSNIEKFQLLREYDVILGFGVDDFAPPKLTESQMDLVSQREIARKNKDFARADSLRKQLAKEGIFLKDGQDKTEWYLDMGGH